MLFASNRVSDFEFAMMYKSRLYFEGYAPCDVCVCVCVWGGECGIFWDVVGV